MSNVDEMSDRSFGHIVASVQLFHSMNAVGRGNVRSLGRPLGRSFTLLSFLLLLLETIVKALMIDGD